MRLRRNALAVATVAAISFTAVAPAQAEASTFVVAQAGSSDKAEGNGDASGSWDDAFSFEGDENAGDRFLTVVKGTLIVVAFATALSVGLGFLRTLIYNVAGV